MIMRIAKWQIRLVMCDLELTYYPT